MAFEHIQFAFEYEDPCSAVAIACLRCIAHMIGKNDSCWPSYDFIGRNIRKSSRMAQRGCKELVDLGLLIIDSGQQRGGSNRFSIVIPGDFHARFLKVWGGRFAAKTNINTLSTPTTPVSDPAPAETDTPGHPCPTGVGQNEGEVGQMTFEGYDTGVRQTIKENNQESEKPITPDTPVLPPPENETLPPLDSMRFKTMFKDACYDAGASEELCERLYARHRTLHWSILAKNTLKGAARNLVYAWKCAHPQDFIREQIRRDALKHGEALPPNPEIP